MVSLGRVNLAAAAIVSVGTHDRVGRGCCGLLDRECQLSPETGCSGMEPRFVAGDRGGAFRLSPALRSTLVADGFMYPTDFDFLADGRIVVATRAGVVRLVDDGRARRQPFLDLRGRVATWGARGLVAIAVDRSATPSRLYVAYAVSPGRQALTRRRTIRPRSVQSVHDPRRPGRPRTPKRLSSAAPLPARAVVARSPPTVSPRISTTLGQTSSSPTTA